MRDRSHVQRRGRDLKLKCCHSDTPNAHAHHKLQVLSPPSLLSAAAGRKLQGLAVGGASGCVFASSHANSLFIRAGK